MRDLKKNCIRWRKHTDGHCDSMTESAQWGRFSEKHIQSNLVFSNQIAFIIRYFVLGIIRELLLFQITNIFPK